MAAKVSTIILDVDLDCHLCYKKIKKTLSKFPEIQSQKFDEKQNKVIIAGAFDPEKLMKKICCMACKYIKSFEIIIPQPAKPKPDAPKRNPPPPKQATPPPEPKLTPVPPPPELAPPPAPPPPKPELKPATPPPEPEPKPDPPQQEPVKKNSPRPPPPPPEPVKVDPPVLLPPSIPSPVPGIPIGPYRPMVCCRPCYEGHHEQGICRRYGYESGCRFFSEEDPYCRTM